MPNFSSELKKLLARKPDANKNDFGHALIIGGDYGMAGAVIMAAEACYRVGAGKVTVFSRSENFIPLLTRLPSAMTISTEHLSEKNLENKTVIVIGCGLGKSEWAQSLLEVALKSSLPKILDADALNILSESKKTFDLSNCVITPHVGEAARLLNISPAEIQENRQLAATKLYEKFGATVVLKGQATLIFDDSKQITQCNYGNSGMAVAGMGDVLSGVIAGLMAQHLSSSQAAIYGVNIHAFAADLVAKKQGGIGMIPSDLFEYFAPIINDKLA